MTHEEYVNGYAKLNKAYNDTFDALQELFDLGFSDPEISKRYNYALNILDEALDIYKNSYVTREEKEKEIPEEKEAEEKPEKTRGFQIFGGKKK